MIASNLKLISNACSRLISSHHQLLEKKNTTLDDCCCCCETEDDDLRKLFDDIDAATSQDLLNLANSTLFDKSLSSIIVG